MSRLWALALSCAAISACATPFQRAEPGDFSVSVTDNVEERRFEVVLVSTATKPLCLSGESWPDESGKFPLGYEAVVLTTTNGLLHPRASITAYCPGGCGEVEIEAGQRLEAIVAYAAFGDAEVIAEDAQRSLEFPVYPYYCSRRR
ncbi:hypothetical protein [Luteimonas huabeiensis]|uniref:hypothetical protein n=1 Tax=Luteimonas huabeiensis TaxID=1244513 RepID=UPI001268B8F2|nr:hypothetical protein [Luteimonas huabeiensis]